MKNFFVLEKQDKNARAGKIVTAHGEIETPIFMPVGTRATVKTLTSSDLKEIKAQIILGNTYHLFLRPGEKLIEEHFSDLHHFMNWDRPILTDSGGFQIFSLGHLAKCSEDGVLFQSHIDGSRHFIGPEKSMEIQKSLGSDIVMAFDECPALPASRERLRESMELTLRWAKRCVDYPLRDYQHLFGIIQGGLEYDLRKECMERLVSIGGFSGFALGGLSVGEKNEEMVEFCQKFVPQMPHDQPRYLMGVGTPLDILKGIKNGLDMFDCVLPTRNARNGQFLTKYGPLNIKLAKYKTDTSPPDESCECHTCTNYSRSYIRHLYTVKEPLAGRLISYHNLWFYQRMVENARKSIFEDSFDDFFAKFYKDYSENRDK